MAEKEVFVNTPTTGDVANFHDDTARTLEFQKFMEGTPVSEGGQHDMLQRGITTDRGEWNQPPDSTGQYPLMPQESQFAHQQVVEQPPQGQPQPPTQGQNWQQLYGRSENEKGDLRRALKEQMDANAQLMVQMQQFLSTPPAPQGVYNGGYSNPYPTPQPVYGQNNGYSQVQPQISYTQPQLPQRFLPVQDGQVPMAEDVEAMVRNYIAPGIGDAYQQAQLARQEINETRQLLLAQAKQAAGITPQVETQALLERPWIRNLQHRPQEYLQALGDYKGSRTAQDVYNRTAPGVPQVPQPTYPASAAPVTRRITYIEGAPQGGTTSDPGAQPNQFLVELTAAAKEPHLGKRANAMRAVYAKYGVSETNDWRDPAVSTR